MSDNETLADRVARTFAKAPAATRDTITQRLTAAWWDNMHVAFEDDNGQWRQALALASEGLDMGAKPPPTPEDIAATLEAEAIAHVERVMGKRFGDILPHTRLAMLAEAQRIILDRRGGQPTSAERVAAEIENCAAVRANYDADQQAYSARTGEPLAPRLSISRQRALEDANDHLRLANAQPSVPAASPI